MAVSFNKPGFKKEYKQNTSEQVIEKTGIAPGTPPEETVLHEAQFQEGVIAAPTPCSVVKVEAGLTVNTGDFNSVRLFVGIEKPCSANQKEEDDSFEHCKSWVGEKLEELYKQYVS